MSLVKNFSNKGQLENITHIMVTIIGEMKGRRRAYSLQEEIAKVKKLRKTTDRNYSDNQSVESKKLIKILSINITTHPKIN